MTPTLLFLLLLGQAPAGPAPAAAPPQAPTATIGRAYFLFLEGLAREEEDDLAGAIENYRQAIELAPRAPEFRTQLAELYAAQNQVNEARAQATAALAAAPKDPDANRLLGWIQYLSLRAASGTPDAKAIDEAISHLELALTGDEPDPRAQLWLSELYLRRADGARAISLLRKFLAEHPDYPEALRMLANAYEVNGQSDGAAEALESLNEAQPDVFEFRVRTIGRLEAAGRWKDAASAWAGLIEQDSSGAIYRTRYAAALGNAGDFTRARQVLADVTRDAPKSTSAWYLTALIEGRAGDMSASDAAVQRIIAINPDDPRAPLALARVRAQRKDYAGAVKALEPRVASPRPSDLATGFYTEMAETLSAAYNNLGKKKQAADALAVAQKHDPKNQRLLFALAAAYDQDGRSDDAEKSLRALIAENAGHADALNYLGYMFAEQGRNLPEAVDLINRALAIERDNPSFLDSLGWAYFKMGQLDKAQAPLEQAATALPEVSVIQDHLGDVYLQLQKYREAGDAFDRALKGDLDGIDASAVTKKRDRARALAGRS
jgi:tetratricopeptide (TPR) repeat protein